jgi:hypothetical protein
MSEATFGTAVEPACRYAHAGYVATSLVFVMAGLVPAIHVFLASKTWMPGTRPGMTRERPTADRNASLLQRNRQSAEVEVRDDSELLAA